MSSGKILIDTMAQSQKIAIVTGSNKGIGFAIVKGLCEKFNGIVYLTSRNVERGENAVKELNDLGLNPSFYQLDIDDETSVNTFRDYIKCTHGGIDLLVNNAAIAFGIQNKETIRESVAHQADFNTLRVCDALFPLLRKDARVVNISSSVGHLSKIPSADLRKQLSDAELTVPQLSALMKQFIDETKTGTHEEKWGNSNYAVSKVGLSALTRVHQKLFENEASKRNISVNSVYPGFVDTDMSSHMGPLTIEEGAKGPLYLSLEPHQLRGGYLWYDCQVVDWLSESTPAPY